MMHQAWLVAKDVLEKESNGVFKVEMYPNAQLGGDQQLQEAVQNGDLTMSACSTSALVTFEPKLGVFTAPFIFPNNQIAYKVLDGEFGQKMLDTMEKSGFKALGYFESASYRELSSNKSVHKPDDLKGVKIRVMQNPLHIALWQNLGASPTPIAFSELYTALQQKTVDAQENPLELLLSQRFYEVQKSVTLTNHIFQVGMATTNLKFYNSLTPELQKVVKNAIKAGVDFQRKKAAEDSEKYISQLRAAKVEVIELSNDELKQFQDKMGPVVKIVSDQVGKDLVDELYAAVKKASN